MNMIDGYPITMFGNEVEISGMIFTIKDIDNKQEHLAYLFPESTKRGNVILETLPLEEWKALIRQLDLVETMVLAKAKDGTLTKVMLRKSARKVEQGVTWKVFDRDEYKCRYCGISGVPMTVDHIILWENGGPSIEENLVTACRKCNKTRGNTDYVEWLKSDFYYKSSKNLSDKVANQNLDLIKTLSQIPIRYHKISR